MMTSVTQASFSANGAIIRLVDDPLLFVPSDSGTPLSYPLNLLGVEESPPMIPPSAGPTIPWSADAFPPFALPGLPAGQGASPSALPGYKLDHLGVAERLFIGAVMNSPQRPWGVVTEMAREFRTSRPTLYTIGWQARQIMFPLPVGRPAIETPSTSISAPLGAVTSTRLQRTLLTLLLPGGVTTRHKQDCLKEAFDLSRSVGFISKLIQEAGQKARQVLEGIDYSVMGPVILARDETFFPTHRCCW